MPWGTHFNIVNIKKKRVPSVNKVAGKDKTSEPSTAGTSQLEWRCFEYYWIHRKSTHFNIMNIKKEILQLIHDYLKTGFQDKHQNFDLQPHIKIFWDRTVRIFEN